jgi:cytochrome c biogenesis protein CcmG/thiol:disulfide interchange protein DsbE
MRRPFLLRKIPAAYLVALFGAGIVVLLAWMSRGKVNPVIAGAEAPAFSAQDAEGVVRSTEEYRGKVLLLNIWATWCETCKEEMPSMQRLYDQFGREDLEILAVSVDAPMGQEDLLFGLPGGDPFAYADSLSLSFPILHDPSADIAATYRITGVPESFVIDQEGIIIRKVAGPAEWDAPGYLELFARLIGQ